MDKKNGKKAITLLLITSCIISGIILAATPPPKNNFVQTQAELDSLITYQILKSAINPQQISIRDLSIDTSFSRKTYNVKVPSRFSKTMFHLDLHRTFRNFDIEVPAKVRFPERDMDIYVYYEDTILRTIRLIGDTSLDTLIIGLNE